MHVVMAFIYIVQMLEKKWCFWSWRLCHWTIKTLSIWSLYVWLTKCKQTLCFLPLFAGYCGWVEWVLEVVWIEIRVMSQCPTALCRAGWAVSRSFARLCWLVSLQREGTWLLNMLHVSTPCSELLSNPAYQNVPSVAGTARHGKQSWIPVCVGTVPPWKACQGWVSLSRAAEKLQVPQASSHQLLWLNCIGPQSCQDLP